MKEKSRLEVAATVALGLVCAVLVLRLVGRVHSVDAREASPAVTVRSLSPRALDPIPRGPAAFAKGPALNVALFQSLQAQPLPPPSRDPFAFEPTPQQLQAISRQQQEAGQAQPAGPPPPPAVPLRALGYTENARGEFQAYLIDAQHLYVVREGEKFGKTYQVLKITPTFVEVQDDALNVRAQLAIPQ
ncbi:MAG: hypothetical protein ACRD3O_01910 [Terriglobia bacterium]